VLEETESSAMLRWSVGSMTNFPRKLIHKIEYKSQWDSNPEHWHVSIQTSMNKERNYIMVKIDSQCVHISDVCSTSLPSNQTSSLLYNINCQERDNDYFYFNITDLKYPFANYDFRIYVRSSLARGEDKWSSPGYVTLKTKPSSELILNKLIIKTTH